MVKQTGDRIRVVLRWIQIKDNKEAAWDDEGEFQFSSKVTSGGMRAQRWRGTQTTSAWGPLEATRSPGL